MIKADLHNHLRTSSRPTNLNEVVNATYKKLGKGGVLGVTNFSDFRYENLINSPGYLRQYVGDEKNGIYIPEKDIYIIKGQEIPTKEGHLLVLGTGEGNHLKEGRTLEDTIKEAKDQNGIIVAVHPFYVSNIGNYLKNNPELVGEIDAIEIHNGKASFGFPVGPLPLNANKKAEGFYKEIKQYFPNLGAVSFSDGHSIYEIGSSWTGIEKPDEKNLANSMRTSLQKTNLDSPKKKTKSYLGAIDHIADMLLINQVGNRIGLKEFYRGKDRPEGD